VRLRTMRGDSFSRVRGKSDPTWRKKIAKKLSVDCDAY